MRSICVFCGSGSLDRIESIPQFPIYMGATNKEKFSFEDLVYGVCQKCKGVQLLNLVGLEKIYDENHNISIVGPLWKGHYLKFADFILSSVEPNNALEIGDPSFKLKKVLLKSKSWTVAQPNIVPSLTLPKNVTYINSFVGEGFSKHFKTKKVDTIIMSHVFEHLYEPVDTLKELRKCLKDNGSIFISIPNFEYINENKLMPPLGLHFEHTFFCDKNRAFLLFDKSGFQVEQVLNFKNHSVFFEIKKSKSNNLTQDLTNTLDHYKNIVKKLNKLSQKFYLYGAHFPAQLLISLKLDSKMVVSILDNAKDKHGKKLYGTDLMIEPLSVIEGDENPIVLCEMGPYSEEIKQQLNNINSGVSFLT